MVGVIDGADDPGVGNPDRRQLVGQAGAAHSHRRAIQLAGVEQRLHQRLDATGPVQVFHMMGTCRTQRAEMGCPGSDLIDFGQAEADPRLVGDGGDMQSCICRAAHGGVDRESVDDRAGIDDIAGF